MGQSCPPLDETTLGATSYLLYFSVLLLFTVQYGNLPCDSGQSENELEDDRGALQGRSTKTGIIRPFYGWLERSMESIERGHAAIVPATIQSRYFIPSYPDQCTFTIDSDQTSLFPNMPMAQARRQI